MPIESILVIEKICTFCLGLKEEKSVSCFVMSNSVISWTVACQTPLSMGFFSRQEYWSGLPFSEMVALTHTLTPLIPEWEHLYL